MSDLVENLQDRFSPDAAQEGGGRAQWLASRTTDQVVPGSNPGLVAVRCGIEQVTFTPCLVLVKHRKLSACD